MEAMFRYTTLLFLISESLSAINPYNTRRYIVNVLWLWLWLLYLMPLSTIFQLYHGCHVLLLELTWVLGLC